MTNKNTTTLIAMALLVSMIGLAPMATAGDNVVRTFLYTLGAEEDFQGSGTGVYDNVNGEVCFGSLLGLRQGVLGSGFYYENYRMHSNSKVYEDTVTGAGTIDLPDELNCPPPVGEGNPQDLHSSDITIRAGVAVVSLDHGVCSQGSNFVDCYVNYGASKASMYTCANPLFSDDAVKQGGIPAMSTAIDACQSGTSTGVLYFDGGPTGSAYADSWSFGTDSWGTDYSLLQVNDVVPDGADSGFVVSCMSTTYTAIDNGVSPPGVTYDNVASGHDWFWAVDVLGDAQPSPISTGLDELYDLNGNDGCPGTPTLIDQPVKA